MRLVKTIVAAVLAAVTTCALADALTDRARQLLRDRQHQQAYQLLLPQEPNRAGDPEFDYLLGIAAIDAGDPERGIFALERVLALQPNNHVARAEIARAYLAVGERQAARREFETVRQQQIPAQAKETVDRYLSAIDAADITRTRGYLEFGFGHDSNVNSATSQSQFAIPGIGGTALFDFSSANREDDIFFSFAAGADFTRKISPAFAVIGAASANTKNNTSEDQFNTYNIDASLGGRYTIGKEALTLGLQLQGFGVDAHAYRRAAGVVGQWQHNFHERSQATLFGQLTKLEYPTQSIRDADRAVVGVGYAAAGTGDRQPSIFVSAYGGQENEEADGVPHLGHDLAGFRLGGQVRMGIGWALFANTSFERRIYGGTDPAFLVRRGDKQYDVSAGLFYLLGSATSLILQIAHTENDSNIVISDFERTVTSAVVRHNF